MRLASVVALTFATTVAACAPDTSAPTSEDVDSVEDQRVEADTVYVVTGRDFRKCAWPMCGGYFVKAINKAKTTCFDGTKQPECYVSDLDLTPMELPEEQSFAVRDRATAGEVLISGNLQPVGGDFGNGFGKLVGFKAWQNRDAGAVSGTAHLVASSGIVCITTPCPSLEARKINSTVVKAVTDLDFAALDLTDDEEAAAGSVAATTGLMATGSMKTKGNKKVFVAKQIFDQVQPELPLCTTDDQCGADAHCDMTECLSPCAPGMVCPAVCMGACKPGAPVVSTSTCQDRCGSSSEDVSCWCDALCEDYGDCCDDFIASCGS